MGDKLEEIFDKVSIFFMLSVFVISAGIILKIISAISEAYNLNSSNRTWVDYFLLAGIIFFGVMLCVSLSPILLAHLKLYIRRQLKKYKDLMSENEKK